MNLASFMAITVHYSARDAKGCLKIRNHCLAFRFVEGKHDGKNLAKIFFEVLKDAGILGKVRHTRFKLQLVALILTDL